MGLDRLNWHEKFMQALEDYRHLGVEAKLVNLYRSDWQESIEACDWVLWKPADMGLRGGSLVKEKVYFLQFVLHKPVMPNFETIWHFESKSAQSYLFKAQGVPTPRTFTGADRAEAFGALDQWPFPLVFKRPAGAASRNVLLVKDRKAAGAIVNNLLFEQTWKEFRDRKPGKWLRILKGMLHAWFWRRQWSLRFYGERSDMVYWQEFMPNNEADLRITVIGDCMAYGFWRRNRPNDFRASGSGRLDYQTLVPQEALHLCLALSRRCNFDSMAYDLLRGPQGWVISEMSYGYLDKALFQCAGHFWLDASGELRFRPGQIWPQTLWVKWLLMRAGVLSTAEAGGDPDVA